MKKISIFFAGLALLLVGCSESTDDTKNKEAEEKKTPMEAMKEEFETFEEEMENGYYFKYDDETTTVELFYLSESEYVYTYSDAEGVSIASCGIDGDYTYSYEGEGNYGPDPETYCNDGIEWVDSTYDVAFKNGYFNSAYDVDYSDGGDYYLANGTYYGKAEKYDFKLFKDGNSILFEDNKVTVIVEVGDIALP